MAYFKMPSGACLHRVVRFLFLCGLLGLSDSVYANNFIPAANGASVWTVYAFGNAQAMSDTFRSLANFTASATFQAIVGFIAVCGALSIGMASGFSVMVARKFIGYCVTVFLICYIFFGVGNGGPMSVNVEVYDVIDGTWVAPVTMPAVIGIPASVIATAGHEITAQIEASFPIPDAMKISGGAPFNLAASIINDASQAKISDPNLANSLAYYVQDCFTIAVASGYLSASVLVQSTDFIKEIEFKSKSVMVNTTLPGTGTRALGGSFVQAAGESNIVTCEDAWKRIDTAVGKNSAADYLKSASAWAKTPALSVVNAAADAAAQWASNSGITDGGAMVKQVAVLSSFNSAFKQSAAATGNSEFLTALNVAQAMDQQTKGWIMSAEIFNRTLGYVYAIVQVFVFAVLPLVLAAALVPGLGFSLIKNFGQILLWLAIWPPMLAVVNFIVLSMQQADLGGALASGGGNYGFSMMNMGIITEKTANMRAAALFVGTMVPALAWGLVKASVDFSRFVGEASGGQFALSAAQSMSTGNFSLNQASMDSFSSNKMSLASTQSWGGGFNSSPTGTSSIVDTDIGGMKGVQAAGSGVALAPTATISNATGTAVNDTGATVAGVLNSISAARSGVATKTGSNGKNISGANATMLSNAANVGVSADFSSKGGKKPVGASDSATTAAAAAAPGQGVLPTTAIQTTQNPKQSLVSDALSRIKPSLGVGAGANTSRTDSAAKVASQLDSGSITSTGTVSDAATVGTNTSLSAANSNTTQNGMSLVQTGIASREDLRQANKSAMAYHNLFAMGSSDANSAENRWHDGKNSRIGQLNDTLNTSEAIPQAAAVQAKIANNQLAATKDALKAERAAIEAAEKEKEAAARAQLRIADSLIDSGTKVANDNLLNTIERSEVAQAAGRTGAEVRTAAEAALKHKDPKPDIDSVY